MARSVVMVVDANPATARRMRRALQDTELDLLVATNMAEAIASAADPELIAIFSAVSIPGGNGYELTRRVVGHRPSMAVYLLWGGFEAFDEDRAMVSGVRAGLRRPFSNEAVLALLEEQLGAVPVSSTALEPVDPPEEELLPVGSIEPLDAPDPDPLPVPPVGGERLATFVPADYDELPPVRIDREEISVALERAVLAVLPEVVEAVVCKAARGRGPLRDAIDRAVARAVRDQLPELLDQALRARLDEPE